MKRIWLGLGVLAALLGIGVWAMLRTESVHGEISRQLWQAAVESDSQQAFQLGEAAQKEWEDHWFFTSAIADHTDMNQIDRMFAQLAVCRQQGDARQHALVCAALSEDIVSIADNHGPWWSNLL